MVDTNSALVRSIISMAKTLRKEVVAEGIEHESQAAFVLEHGCDYGQGFYYSEPLGNEAFLQYAVNKGGMT